MTYLNFSDYLKTQLNRDIQSEEFSRFILNQKLLKIGKRSAMNANTFFFFENHADVVLAGGNEISGADIEFHSCDRNTIYYAVTLPESPVQESLLLKAELDKATVANNLIFLIKRISLITVKDLNKTTVAVKEEELVEAYA